MSSLPRQVWSRRSFHPKDEKGGDEGMCEEGRVCVCHKRVLCERV